MTFSSSVFDFTDEEIREAAAKNRLLAMEIEFNRACNYRCPYCYAGDQEPDSRPLMSSEQIDSVLHQASELGARKIVILGGEPLLYEGLEEKFKLITSLGMGIEIFTNASLIDEEVAAMLSRYQCRVVVKLNSLKAEVQEYMTGVPNALNIALDAIEVLKRSGFIDPEHLAASTVISSANADGLLDLWKYLRLNDITPYFEVMTPQGRLLENQGLMVHVETLKKLFEEIADFDLSLGRKWDVQPPLVGGKCFRHTYSCLVNASGQVMPCVGVTMPIGHVGEESLQEILASSSIIRHLKDFRRYIKGPCRSCEKADQCYGCRGAAYQMTGDYLASDPLCWNNGGRLHEIKTLPCDATKLIPHRPPMTMIDSLLSCGEEHQTLAVIRPDNRFLNADGVLDRAVYPELAAQASAATDSFREGGVVREGMLAGLNRFEVNDDAVVGDELLVTISETSRFNAFHIIEFRIHCRNRNHRLIASGELKLCVSD